MELFYFVANIVLAVVALYGLQQIALLKKDIRIRTERAAKEKAIEFSSRYLNHYVPLDAKFLAAMTKANVPLFKGKVEDFTSTSITKNRELFESTNRRYGIEEWLPAVNELEAIAAAFISGVADERTGFGIIGKSFCDTVGYRYDLIAFSRSPTEQSHDYWKNIVELYRIWSPRLLGSRLRDLKERVNVLTKSVIANESSITPIGYE